MSRAVEVWAPVAVAVGGLLFGFVVGERWRLEQARVYQRLANEAVETLEEVVSELQVCVDMLEECRGETYQEHPQPFQSYDQAL